MARNKYGYRRKRGGSRVLRKHKRRGRRGSRLIKRVRRINRFLKNKGIRSIEIKYNQGAAFADNTATGPNAIYGISERAATLQGNASSAPTSNKFSPSIGITQGTGRSGRVGNKIFIRHLRVKGCIWASTNSNAANEVYVSILVLRTKQQPGSITTDAISGQVPYIENNFDQVSPTGTRWAGTGWQTSGAPTAKSQVCADYSNMWHYTDLRWKNDFDILKYKVVKVSKETGVNSEKKKFKFNLRVMKPAYWSDSGAPQDGHIYVYWWCDNAFQNPALPVASIVAGDRPDLGMTWRLTFTDV